jgi:hypothetical protein
MVPAAARDGSSAPAWPPPVATPSHRTVPRRCILTGRSHRSNGLISTSQIRQTRSPALLTQAIPPSRPTQASLPARTIPPVSTTPPAPGIRQIRAIRPARPILLAPRALEIPANQTAEANPALRVATKASTAALPLRTLTNHPRHRLQPPVRSRPRPSGRSPLTGDRTRGRPAGRDPPEPRIAEALTVCAGAHHRPPRHLARVALG